MTRILGGYGTSSAQFLRYNYQSSDYKTKVNCAGKNAKKFQIIF